MIFKLAHKLSKSKTKNFLKVIDDYGLNSIVELTLIDVPNEFKDKSLENLKIKQNYGLSVLAIERGNKIINNVTKEEIFTEKDIVTLYGNFNTIKELFIDNVEREKEENKIN